MNIKQFLRRLVLVILFCAFGIVLNHYAEQHLHKPPASIPDVSLHSAVTTQDILRQLSTVLDPEIDINIVDLGLIHRVDITDTVVTITLVVTSPFCPFLEVIDRMIKEALLPFSRIDKVIVVVDDSIMWNHDMMTDQGKKKLEDLYSGY